MASKFEKLKSLVKQGESEVLEFKKRPAQLSAAMQTVCAFLNSPTGGTVLIGVTDDKQIFGQEITVHPKPIDNKKNVTRTT